MDDKLLDSIETIAYFAYFFYWVVGLTAAGAAGTVITVIVLLKGIREDTIETLVKIKQVETVFFKYGNSVKSQLDKNYQQTDRLSHFVQVNIRNQTGKEPSPPI